MEKVVLFKNKPELFRCQFSIDGIEPKDAIIRLCLEFADNNNLFFKGKLNAEGSCEIAIPALKELKQKEGKLFIEAIADSTHFIVYEAKVELKKSVDVQLLQAESTTVEKEQRKVKITDAKIGQEDIVVEEKIVKKEKIFSKPIEKKIVEESKENPYFKKPEVKTQKINESVKKENPFLKKTPSVKVKGLKTFKDFKRG